MQKRPLVIHTPKKKRSSKNVQLPVLTGFGWKVHPRVENREKKTVLGIVTQFDLVDCIAVFCGSISRLFVSWPTRTEITISTSLWDRKKAHQMPNASANFYLSK